MGFRDRGSWVCIYLGVETHITLAVRRPREGPWGYWGGSPGKYWKKKYHSIRRRWYRECFGLFITRGYYGGQGKRENFASSMQQKFRGISILRRPCQCSDVAQSSTTSGHLPVNSITPRCSRNVMPATSRSRPLRETGALGYPGIESQFPSWSKVS